MSEAGAGTKTKWLVYLGISVLLVGAVVSGFLLRLEQAEANKVPPGVSVRGLDMSNWEREQVEEKLEELAQDLSTQEVSVVFEDQTRTVSLEELGFTVNVNDTLDQVFTPRDHSLLQQWKAYFQPANREIALSVWLDKDKLALILNPMLNSIERPATDASFKIEDGEVLLIPDQKGRKVNYEQIYNDLVQAIRNGKELKIALKTDELEAGTTLQEIEALKINGKIGEFTTYFDGENTNRRMNIKLAADKINNLMLKPGQEFSFNQTVGARTAAAGFRPARVIVGNEFDEALGGGICQVSTTLYNAILLANLTLVERHNHSLAVSYVPLGRDAAVAWDLLDFKFKNTLPGHAYLRTNTGRNYITVQVYGDTKTKQDVTIRSWVTETVEADPIIKEDSSLAPGEETVVDAGYKGFKAQAERIIRDNGEIVGREALPASRYYPKAKIIHVGPSEEKAMSKEEVNSSIEEKPDHSKKEQEQKQEEYVQTEF
ncbi:VanW family protein [Desulforamulus ruminis]|uniref:VanW family protein n=1 Tax=Desulforamulus ruminis TaxID=1564 RepID=UPI002FD9A455